MVWEEHMESMAKKDSCCAEEYKDTPLRAVFMGTPAFSATVLSHVLSDSSISVVAAYTQPDRPAGRGKSLKEPEVKLLAKKHGIPVFQPQNFKDPRDIAQLAECKPDVLLVAAYGLILPQAVLSIPTYMPLNVHASLLPKYRGAAPIQRAIMDGLDVTGITIMRMEAGLDTGPMLLQGEVTIDIDDTSSTLHDKLAESGGSLLVEALHLLRANSLSVVPQNNALATHAAKLKKEDGIIDFTMNARDIHALIRSVTPWPTASFSLIREGKEPITVSCEPGIFPFEKEVAYDKTLKPGYIIGLYKGALLVRCNDGCYAFTKLRPAGKKAVDAQGFYNGYLAGTSSAFADRLVLPK